MIHVVFFLAQRAACLEQRWCRTVDSRPFQWTAVPSRVSAVAQKKRSYKWCCCCCCFYCSYSCCCCCCHVAAATATLLLTHCVMLQGSSRVAPRPSKTKSFFLPWKQILAFCCCVLFGEGGVVKGTCFNPKAEQKSSSLHFHDHLKKQVFFLSEMKLLSSKYQYLEKNLEKEISAKSDKNDFLQKNIQEVQKHIKNQYITYKPWKCIKLHKICMYFMYWRGENCWVPDFEHNINVSVPPLIVCKFQQ